MRPHGTVSLYRNGCHCIACRKANADAQANLYVRRKLDGPQLLPAARTVDHIERLHESGIAYDAIGRLAGTSGQYVCALLKRRDKLITRRLADNICAIQPGDFSKSDYVPAEQAIAVVDDMKAMGLTKRRISAAMGRRSGLLKLSGRGRTRVRRQTYHKLLVIAAAVGARSQLDVLRELGK